VLQKIAALYPDNPFVHFHLAQYYSIYGEDIEAAFTELEKAFQRGLPYDSIYSADRLFLAPLEMKWNRWKDLLKKYYAEQTKYW
ncbi:MAG TPA: hypothetical protein VJ917_11535, partial [Saprospiraceae bacterium]|nr:hypothetical protein [Saprospiraceae bacterium]